MTHTPACQVCTGRTTTALCDTCTIRLRRWLHSAPALLADLDVSVARLDRTATPNGPRTADRPLVYSPEASDARWHLAATLAATALELAAQHGYALTLPGLPRLHPATDRPALLAHTLPESAPTPAGTAAARWLLAHLDALRHADQAGEWFRDLDTAVRRAERMCAPRPPQWYAGPCDSCGADLLAPTDGHGNPTVTAVTCRACHREHDLACRRERLIDRARCYLVHVHTGLTWARVLLGKAIPRGTWDSWVARGRITPQGIDPAGRPLFLFGDIEQLARAYTPRRGRMAA